jgi:hypothetical protein
MLQKWSNISGKDSNNQGLWWLCFDLNMLLRQVNISRVVLPDLIRHPVFSMDVACASEDTGSRALIGNSPE